jgi:uncharacterized protein (TIGR03437 family)
MRNCIGMLPVCFVVSIASSLSAQVSIAGVGHTAPTPPYIAPGEVTTLFVSGLQTYIPTPLVATAVPLPTSLGGISVGLQQGSASYTVPLFRIQQSSSCVDATDTSPACMVTAITIQVPFEIVSGPPTVEVTIIESGTVSKSFAFESQAAHIHVLTTCDSVFGYVPSDQLCAPIVTHADYTPVSPVNGSLPASAGEVVTVWAVGLGPSQPQVATGQATPPYIPLVVGGPPAIEVTYDFTANAAPAIPAVLTDPSHPAPTDVIFVGLAPGYVGLYQIAVAVPAVPPGTKRCGFLGVNSNLTISLLVEGGGLSDGAPICVNIPQ